MSIEALPATLSARGDLGCPPGFANRSDQTELRGYSRSGRHSAHGPNLDQQRGMASELGIELACMVLGRDGKKAQITFRRTKWLN